MQLAGRVRSGLRGSSATIPTGRHGAGTGLSTITFATVSSKKGTVGPASLVCIGSLQEMKEKQPDWVEHGVLGRSF